MPSRVAMARRRRSKKKIPKFRPALLMVLLVLGGLGSLFGHKDHSASTFSAPNPQAVTKPVEATTIPEKQLASAPAGSPTGSAPIPSVETPPQTARKPPAATRFVKGRKVALRDGPGKQFGILDRYDRGREVSLLETQGEWCHIRDTLTQRDGWISASLLSDRPPPPPERKNEATSEKKPEPPSAFPAISDALVVQRIIAESIAMYSGSCACPYNVDRAGRRCGKRSAYNRGGGYAPLCFAGDVSADMISSFRQQASR
ncbi:SH3 domain-containing protein [Rhizobium ruizarguesonis]|uniref:SH3 domain-containing protein n=1 Tax=Rhizobium ruizarguesonis TaxID=2081791 RepID=UPI00102FCBD9|nr:SH3 domain-containing protein [Rhizobium ruizarguesonis]